MRIRTESHDCPRNTRKGRKDVMSCERYEAVHSRRAFLGKCGLGVGAAALARVMGADAFAAVGGARGLPHFPAKAKRVICLFQSGGPSHLDLLDPKPLLAERFNEDLPDSVRQGQRITGMVA